MFSCLCLNPRTHGWRRYPLSNRFLGVFARNECLLPYFAVFDNKRKVHFPEVSDGGLMNCHRVSRTSGSDATLKRVVIVFLTKLVSETNRCTPLTFCCSLTKTTYNPIQSNVIQIQSNPIHNRSTRHQSNPIHKISISRKSKPIN
jgi:hypothetical protein